MIECDGSKSQKSSRILRAVILSPPVSRLTVPSARWRRASVSWVTARRSPNRLAVPVGWTSPAVDEKARVDRPGVVAEDGGGSFGEGVFSR
jgi:hypothetical protein